MGNPFLGTNVVTQIAVLVNDIEKAVEDYASFFGVEKPGIIITDEYENARTEFMGEPTLSRTKQAFFNVGPQVTIELLEPDKEPSTWRKELDEKGEGVHHIAFCIEGMGEKIKLCGDRGMKLIQKGQWSTGRYAYIDTLENLKVMVELLEFDKK